MSNLREIENSKVLENLETDRKIRKINKLKKD